MFRYDIHTHVFHPKIREKALNHLVDHYKIPTMGDASPEDLISRLQSAGLDKGVIHSLATTAEQVIPANNWAIHVQENYNELVAFGTIHINFDNWEAELDRLQENHIPGLKLHADFQGYSLDDKRLKPILEAIHDRFILMMHVGDDADPETHFSSPQKVAGLKKEFPQLKIIAAHFGGYRHWQYVSDAYQNLDIFIDTSSSLPFITDKDLKGILKTIPKENILFGSDYPVYDPAIEILALQKRLKLSDSELEKLTTNAKKLFL